MTPLGIQSILKILKEVHRSREAWQHCYELRPLFRVSVSRVTFPSKPPPHSLKHTFACISPRKKKRKNREKTPKKPPQRKKKTEIAAPSGKKASSSLRTSGVTFTFSPPRQPRPPAAISPHPRSIDGGGGIRVCVRIRAPPFSLLPTTRKGCGGENFLRPPRASRTAPSQHRHTVFRVCMCRRRRRFLRLTVWRLRSRARRADTRSRERRVPGKYFWPSICEGSGWGGGCGRGAERCGDRVVSVLRYETTRTVVATGDDDHDNAPVRVVCSRVYVLLLLLLLLLCWGGGVKCKVKLVKK